MPHTQDRPSVWRLLSHPAQSPIPPHNTVLSVRAHGCRQMLHSCALRGAILTCSGRLLPSLPASPCPSRRASTSGGWTRAKPRIASREFSYFPVEKSILVILLTQSGVCHTEITCWSKRRELVAAIQKEAFVFQHVTYISLKLSHNAIVSDLQPTGC